MTRGGYDWFVEQIFSKLPRNWFPEDNKLISAMVGGLAAIAAFLYDQISQIKAQSRLATASGIFLDMIAEEFLGTNKLPRIEGETDDAYRARIQRNIIGAKGTRQSILNKLFDLTGIKQKMFEPGRIADTGCIASREDPTSGGFALNTGTGGWGSRVRNNVYYLDVELPQGVGNPGIAGVTHHHITTPDPIETTPAPVFLCLGQSNALGYLIPRTDVPTHLQPAMANAKIWDTPNATWVNLRAGYNTGTPANPENFGPESQFAYDWCAAHPGKTCYIVKSVKGSTPLALDPVGQDWSPNSVGDLFDIAQAAVTAAKANLTTNGINFKVRAALWMQGEQDASISNATANAYAGNLTEFVGAVRSRMGDADTSFILGRIHGGTGFTYGGPVRAAQANIGNVVANSYWVDTDSYPMNPGDNLHFTTAGQVMMGNDMFGVYPEPPPTFDYGVSTDTFIPMPGGYGEGSIAYGSRAALLGAISDDDIYQVIEDYSAAGTHPFVKITRGNSPVIPYNYPPVWDTPAGDLGAYNETSRISIALAATDPEGEPVTYTLANGNSLPAGLTLDANTGIISGVLGNALTDTSTAFAVVASDPEGKAVSRQFSLTNVHLNTPPVWQSNANVGSFVTGNAVSLTLTASDQEGDAISYAVAPGSAMPTGLALASNGAVSGYFTNIGSQSFTIRATDARYLFTDRTFTANVALGAAVYIGNGVQLSSSGVITKPTGLQAGDFAMIFGPGSVNAVSGGDGNWTFTGYGSGSGWPSQAAYKVLTQNDVGNTLTVSGSSWGPLQAVYYRGPVAASFLVGSRNNNGNSVTLAMPAASNSACGFVAYMADRDVGTSNNVTVPTGYSKRIGGVGSDNLFATMISDYLAVPMPNTNASLTWGNFSTGNENWGYAFELLGPNDGEFHQPSAIDRTYENPSVIELPGNGATVFDFGSPAGGSDGNIAFKASAPVSNATVWGFEINCGDIASGGQACFGVCSNGWFDGWKAWYPYEKPPNSAGPGRGLFYNTLPGNAYFCVNYNTGTSYGGCENGATALYTSQAIPLSSQIIGVMVNTNTRKFNLFINGVLKQSLILSPSATGTIYPFIGTWNGQVQGSFRATKSTFWNQYYV